MNMAVVLCALLLSTAETRWSGMVTNAELKAKAPEHGWIVDEMTWTSLWKAWRPDQRVPNVNFRDNFVIVGTVDGPNLVAIRPRLENGDLKYVVTGTLRGGPGFGYQLLVVSREGVKKINGRPLNSRGKIDESFEESISVRVVGTLKTGIFAIGGETTGTVITSGNITWELDVSGIELPPAELSELNNKKVVVKGTLELRSGVETQARWIVTVSSLEPVKE